MKLNASILVLAGCFVVTTVFGADAPKSKEQPAPAQPAAQVDPDQLFGQLDADRNGKLSDKEFDRLIALSPRLKDNPALARQLFAKFDTDKDGALSQTEFKAWMAMRNNPNAQAPAGQPASAQPGAGQPRPGQPGG